MLSFKQFCIEVLDKASELKVIKHTEKTFRCKAIINNRDIEFRLDKWPHDITLEDEKRYTPWNFTFVELNDDYRDGETYDKTGSGSEFEVFASAKKFLELGIDAVSPEVILFEADKTKGLSRTKLYKRFVQRWQPAGYRYRESNIKDDEVDYYSFVKN